MGEPDQTTGRAAAASEQEAAAREPEVPAGDAHEASEAGAAQVETDLEAMLADVTRERDEYLDLARRAKADFENFRKRAARDAAEAEARGKAGLARALLPSIDNLDRAIKAAGGGGAPGDGEDRPSDGAPGAEALAHGIALVHSELEAALARAGVESFEPQGERFDPNVHEAISTRPADDGQQAGVVVETLERGYRIGEQVLRPARVIVAE